MTRSRSLSIFGLLLSTACHTPASPAQAPVATAPAPANERYADADHQDVIVGSFLGMDDVALQRIGEVFGRDHIVWSAYGSLGYTLIVRTAQGSLARAVLRDDPVLAQRVGVLDPLSL